MNEGQFTVIKGLLTRIVEILERQEQRQLAPKSAPRKQKPSQFPLVVPTETPKRRIRRS